MLLCWVHVGNYFLTAYYTYQYSQLLCLPGPFLLSSRVNLLIHTWTAAGQITLSQPDATGNSQSPIQEIRFVTSLLDEATPWSQVQGCKWAKTRTWDSGRSYVSFNLFQQVVQKLQTRSDTVPTSFLLSHGGRPEVLCLNSQVEREGRGGPGQKDCGLTPFHVPDSVRLRTTYITVLRCIKPSQELCYLSQGLAGLPLEASHTYLAECTALFHCPQNKIQAAQCEDIRFHLGLFFHFPGLSTNNPQVLRVPSIHFSLLHLLIFLLSITPQEPGQLQVFPEPPPAPCFSSSPTAPSPLPPAGGGAPPLSDSSFLHATF